MGKDLNRCAACGQFAGRTHKCPITVNPSANSAGAGSLRRSMSSATRDVLSAKKVAELRSTSALTVKTRSFREVTHVGSFDEAGRADWSLEGEGVSVSVDPESWVRIARLGGRKWWTLTRDDGKPITFLDAHKLTKKQRDAIHRWGIEEGIVKEVTAYHVLIWDEDEEMHFTMSTYDEALSEMMDPDDPEEIAERITEVKRLSFTEGNTQRGGELGNAEDILLTVWVERNTDYDGVWWNDTLDEARLSAPRGVIVPSRIPAMSRCLAR